MKSSFSASGARRAAAGSSSASQTSSSTVSINSKKISSTSLRSCSTISRGWQLFRKIAFDDHWRGSRVKGADAPTSASGWSCCELTQKLGSRLTQNVGRKITKLGSMLTQKPNNANIDVSNSMQPGQLVQQQRPVSVRSSSLHHPCGSQPVRRSVFANRAETCLGERPEEWGWYVL